MPVLVTNSTRTTVWALRNDDGFRRQISPQEFRASRVTPEVWTDEEIAQVPEYLGPEPPIDLEALAAAIAPLVGTVDQVARDEALHANEAVTRIGSTISDIRMGGQRIADAGGH